MSAKKPVPLPEFQPRRIALIKPSALGDVIHTLPVLSALRRRYPQAHLTWIVNRNYADLLRGHPDLDQVLPFDRHAPQKEWLEAALGYGQFITITVNFIIIAWILFLVIKGMNRVFQQEQAAPPPPAPPTKEQELLAEIRDLLRARA